MFSFSTGVDVVCRSPRDVCSTTWDHTESPFGAPLQAPGRATSGGSGLLALRVLSSARRFNSSAEASVRDGRLLQVIHDTRTQHTSRIGIEHAESLVHSARPLAHFWKSLRPSSASLNWTSVISFAARVRSMNPPVGPLARPQQALARPVVAESRRKCAGMPSVRGELLGPRQVVRT